MAVNFDSPEGLFDASHTLFWLYKVYSIADGHWRSISPLHLFPQHDFLPLVLGDLNIHYPSPGRTCYVSDYEHFISSPYFDRAADLSFSPFNTTGVYTRFAFTTTHHPEVLDLLFANNTLVPYFSSWNPSLLPTGSDHFALSIVFSTPLLKPPHKGLNWKSTDWDLISPLLADLILAAPPALPTPYTLDL